METYKPILEAAIYSIPIFVILGVYFFIYVLFGKYSSKIKKIIYLAGIFVLLTIIFPWNYIRITTGAIAFILLWSSMFFCTNKKDIIQIGLAITFMMFPAFILLCFFKSMGWAFNHSGMQPHAHAICSLLIYLTVIWLPVFIKCTLLNIKHREEKEPSSKEPENKAQEKETAKSQDPFFKSKLRSIMLTVILIFAITSTLRWGVKLEGDKVPGQSILKEESFESRISLMTVNSGLINSFHIAISPKKSSKLKILWNKSSYSIDGEDQGKNPFACSNSKTKNRAIILLYEQDISPSFKIIIFPKRNYNYRKSRHLKNLERGAVHCVKLVIASNGKEYTQAMKVKIDRTIKLGLGLLHPLGLFYTLIRIPLIIILLTTFIISRLNSRNIKIILGLAAANLFVLSLWGREYLFFILMTSFILYLISAWLSKKNKDTFSILTMNLLLIIPIFRSIYYFYMVYFNNTRIDKTLWTTIIIVFLTAIVLFTAYIKYSKVKETPHEELENKIV